MNVTKFYFILCFILSVCAFGQKPPYPKDTIYLKFKDTIFKNPKMKSKSLHFFNQKEGIKFWWNGRWMFYDLQQKPDTLCIEELKNYHFSDLKDINERRYKWVFDNKRPPADRNGVFQTYLIEVISKKEFVIYPVIWRNEGVID